MLKPKTPEVDPLAATIPAYVPPEPPVIPAAPSIPPPAPPRSTTPGPVVSGAASASAAPAHAPEPLRTPTPQSSAPVSPQPAGRMSKSAWTIGVPIAIVVLGLLLLALLTGMPFGGDRGDTPRRDAPAMETIGEGAAPAGSDGRELVVPDDEQALDSAAKTTTTTPAKRTTAPPPTTATTAPRSVPIAPPAVDREPAAEPRREASRESRPAERQSQPQGEITQPQAEATLRGYIASRAELGVTGDCLAISPVEYKNRGYTMSAADRCDDKPLGRWRVDSLTREVFRQQGDGRFLRP